jgi:hypothetical protein
LVAFTTLEYGRLRGIGEQGRLFADLARIPADQFYQRERLGLGGMKQKEDPG